MLNFSKCSKYPKTRLIYYSNPCYYHKMLTLTSSSSPSSLACEEKDVTPSQLISRALQMAIALDSSPTTTVSNNQNTTAAAAAAAIASATTSASDTTKTNSVSQLLLGSAAAAASESDKTSNSRILNVIRAMAIKTASLLEWNLMFLEKESVYISLLKVSILYLFIYLFLLLLQTSNGNTQRIAGEFFVTNTKRRRTQHEDKLRDRYKKIQKAHAIRPATHSSLVLACHGLHKISLKFVND